MIATGDVLFPVNTMETKKSPVQEASWAMTAAWKALPRKITPMKNMSSRKIIPWDQWDSSKLPRAFSFFLSGDINKTENWHKALQWVSDSLVWKGDQERILKSMISHFKDEAGKQLIYTQRVDIPSCQQQVISRRRLYAKENPQQEKYLGRRGLKSKQFK